MKVNQLPIGDEHSDNKKEDRTVVKDGNPADGTIKDDAAAKDVKPAAGRWRLILPWCAVLLWMVVVFLFSADNMDESAEKSNALFAFLEALFFEDGIAQDVGGSLRFLVRKFGHLTEFFTLGALVSNAWVVTLTHRGGSRTFPKSFWRSVALCTFYAMTDEFHQLFVPGRVASPIDVGIDAAGAILGIIILLVIRHRHALRVSD